MNEAQLFYLGMAYAQFIAGGVSGPPGGGDDPNRPWVPPKSSHEADAVPAAPQRNKKPASPSSSSRGRRRHSGVGPHPCPVCDRRFDCAKAVHGHQRSHPERAWRGMEPQPEPPAYPLSADGKQLRYTCERCGNLFETRQALGGHRASHNGKLGCYWLSKQQQQEDVEPAQPPMPLVLPFDLNEPAVPEQPEEDDEE